MSGSPVVVVTGANGLVGSHVCAALLARGAHVRAAVRRPGTAPALDGCEERVGAFDDPAFASSVLAGATAAVTTVHPMGSDREAQEGVGVAGTTTFARAAGGAGVSRLVHLSTAAVYDRSPDVGDVDEESALVGDDANDYAATKRDADLALAALTGFTRVLVRPPAILGPGEQSVWNTLRPAGIREHEEDRHAVPDQTFAWVHVTDLASFVADVATGRVVEDGDPARGPVSGGCTPVNVCAGSAKVSDYYSTVAAAVGVDPVWDDRPAWRGSIPSARARRWGWDPAVGITEALAEVEAGLRD